jgi:hypothetical protein
MINNADIYPLAPLPRFERRLIGSEPIVLTIELQGNNYPYETSGHIFRCDQVSTTRSNDSFNLRILERLGSSTIDLTKSS